MSAEARPSNSPAKSTPNSAPAPDRISISPIETASSISKQVSIRGCHSHGDLKLCIDLQRRIWNFDDKDLVPAAIFVVAQHTGGHAYLAFHDENPVGFALAFSAKHSGHRFWHSHMVGVLPDYQNQGAGRLLKLHQRDEALRFRILLIEWTFDPLELRNAHLNIARLGVIVRQYIPNCYGETTSPLHGSLPTDRLVAEWHVNSTRVRTALAGRAPPAVGRPAVETSVPTTIRHLRTADPDRARHIQAELRRKLTDLFSRGYAVIGFRRGSENCEYMLEPHKD
jgi:predicted GNAT superfamily acetyltransferase